MHSRFTLSNFCTPGDPLEPGRTPPKTQIIPAGGQSIQATAPTLKASEEAWKVPKKLQVSLLQKFLIKTFNNPKEA